jgi:FAD/FMN-containing dehydrogenase
LAGEIFERNRLLSDSAEWFANHSTNSTDILVECFVPPGEFEACLEDLRRIIPKQKIDLLNVTVRHVNEDQDVFLRYADREMIALVMLFQQPMNVAGEDSMRMVTQEIISSALRHGGRYYLPYRGHATKEQFYQAYPQARQFFARKRAYDPEEIFGNGFYRQYGK